MSQLPAFDPQQVPVFQVDAHLQAVPAQHLTAEALQARFANPPVWQPELVRERKFMDRAPAQAAVLLGLVMRDEPTVLLTQRPAHMSTHAGQIAFAGGKCDEGDADVAATALREAQEEVGLEAHHVQVLGTLPEYVTGSAFYVTPVVALISPDMTLQLNTHEVADAFEVPLAFLMNPANHRWHRYEFEGVTREWLSMPYQDGEQLRFVWGATAGMLRNFYRFLRA
ncbi:CoA pyrophosphatase [Limnohabitans sp. TEGF004]|uniref:CoA pyrophosphatase n=1 Tax=Limnohabitans sp. TEGF004 TaxID=2986281 RepID=UPI0023777B94|nr:CoA pyrophosphatase [Limnohabitans sp. TEGF004]BDU56139.1 coenzyme A pyrophosphatase [Limnohabitans sp. TEGF004]